MNVLQSMKLCAWFMLYDKRGLFCVILFCMFMYVLKNSNCFHSSVTEQYTDDTETFFSDIYFSEWITKIIFLCGFSWIIFFISRHPSFRFYIFFPLFFFGSPYKHTSLSFHHFNIHFLCLVSKKNSKQSLKSLPFARRTFLISWNGSLKLNTKSRASVDRRKRSMSWETKRISWRWAHATAKIGKPKKLHN